MTRYGWTCPHCHKVMSPDVTEHSCAQLAQVPYVPHYPPVYPYTPAPVDWGRWPITYGGGHPFPPPAVAATTNITLRTGSAIETNDG